MIPSPGRIVAYTLTEQDVQMVGGRRREHLGDLQGNSPAPGEVYPLVITRVWGDHEGSAVNGQVMLDGNDTLWVTSRVEGPDAGQWRPFPRV